MSDTLTWIHVSLPKKLLVTIVFDSDKLIRSPDDDPQGLKRIVIKNHVNIHLYLRFKR
jgi:hypothetical protein